jgi:hypothetical protein
MPVYNITVTVDYNFDVIADTEEEAYSKHDYWQDTFNFDIRDVNVELTDKKEEY